MSLLFNKDPYLLPTTTNPLPWVSCHLTLNCGFLQAEIVSFIVISCPRRHNGTLFLSTTRRPGLVAGIEAT